MAGLTLRDVKKRYGETQVMHGVDLDIEDGEFVVFVGPSGCGKSTLLRMIAGLEKITGGELQIDGQVVNDVPPAQRGIAMVFQSYALYPHMTVRENMSFALKLAKKTPAEIDEAVNRAAKILQLDEYLDRLPKALSGGQRRRLEIARTMATKPAVVLLDEPFAGVDPISIDALHAAISAIRADGIGVLITDHNVRDMLRLVDRAILIDQGIVLVEGTPEEITADKSAKERYFGAHFAL